MSATASQTLPSPARRQHSYAPNPERQHYSPSSPRNPPPASPRRSMSHDLPSTSHSRSASGAKAQLANVAQRDFERSNVAKPSEPRRSESKDRQGSSTVARSQSTRNPSTSTATARHVHSRTVSETPSAHSAMPGEEKSRQGSNIEPQGQPRRRTTIDASTGTWELGKTIGAGSMGKVKLARNRETNEQVAVKIVPRQSTDEHKNAQERERADKSKEVRTAREAAIVTLVDHPYVCGMRDVVKTRYHWYMLFEYVNGGQMLDYIISHGRLKEKQARKFGRQIASALDYCHRNSIVHRDLKIENILISKTGDIKIIDFGLSNTFSPKTFLKTFCGSLYFAAPELLQAKQYTGPEVDVWSFGIVLYVLVCGKVPFDDQSMPQLHAKIKKGTVDYPPWLTTECRMLIGRMLQTDPHQRANMSEIMNHAWMVKGFGGPPENYVPPRTPLTLPLDRKVIRKMDGFDFGSANGIEDQLVKIVESEDYQRAVRNYDARSCAPNADSDRKRGVFEFYKRRNSVSRDNLNGSTEQVLLGQDPINGFSPLISIYYLAKEKIEREQREANPGAFSIPKDPGEKPLQLPDLPAPEAAYTNAASYEMSGEKTGGRARPRARTHGEDEVADDLAKVKIQEPPSTPQVIVPPEQTPPRKESMAGGILRRLSTRRHRDHDRGDRDRTHPPPSLSVSGPSDGSNVPRKSFSIRRREPSASRADAKLNPPDAGNYSPDLLAPSPPSETAARRTGLGRSTSVNSGDHRRRNNRRGVSEGSSMRPPATPPSDYRPSFEQGRLGADAASDVEAPRTAPPASRTKSLGHARRESIQNRRAQRAPLRTSNVPEETDAQLEDHEDDFDGDDGSGLDANAGSPGGMKPVFLKGLFSVSTTSNKPFKVIEADIVRVLKQLGVEYQSNGKGGFKCKHTPSINFNRNDNAKSARSHRRKISFNMGLRGPEEYDDSSQQPLKGPQTPNSFRSNERNRREQSDDNISPNDSENEDVSRVRSRRKFSPATPTMAAGETSTHVQNDMGNNLDLRFEIFVVKVPLLSLHGIQFKKVDGGTWQYKNMAQKILDNLRL